MHHPDISELISLGRELVEKDLVLGSGGNLSLRVGDVVYISRSGAQLHELAPEDFLAVDLNVPYQRPDASPRPSTETPMHLAAYHARPQATAIIHCHPVHAIAWAMQGTSLPACTPDVALYLGDRTPNLPYLLPGSKALAKAVAKGLRHYPAILLGNHGILVTGETVALARLRTLHIEETAHICLLAAAAGRLRPLQPDEYAEIIATYGKK